MQGAQPVCQARNRYYCVTSYCAKSSGRYPSRAL